MTAETWSAISAIAAAVAAIVSMVQILEIRRASATNEAAARTLRTFEYSPSASPAFFDARQKIGVAFGGWYDSAPANLELVKNTFQADYDTRDAFNYILNHYGRLASAIHHGIVDESVAEELFKLSYLAFWRKYGPYLESQFEASPTLGQQYVNSAALVKRWSNEGRTL